MLYFDDMVMLRRWVDLNVDQKTLTAYIYIYMIMDKYLH